MKAYIRSSNGSDVQSEVMLAPIDSRSIRFDRWLQSLTPAQRIFVHRENSCSEGGTYGPDADDLQIPEIPELE